MKRCGCLSWWRMNTDLKLKGMSEVQRERYWLNFDTKPLNAVFNWSDRVYGECRFVVVFMTLTESPPLTAKDQILDMLSTVGVLRWQLLLIVQLNHYHAAIPRVRIWRPCAVKVVASRMSRYVTQMLQVSHAMPAMFVGQYRDGGSEVDQILPWPQERYLHLYVPRHMFLSQSFGFTNWRHRHGRAHFCRHPKSRI